MQSEREIRDNIKKYARFLASSNPKRRKLSLIKLLKYESRDILGFFLGSTHKLSVSFRQVDDCLVLVVDIREKLSQELETQCSVLGLQFSKKKEDAGAQNSFGGTEGGSRKGSCGRNRAMYCVDGDYSVFSPFVKLRSRISTQILKALETELQDERDQEESEEQKSKKKEKIEGDSENSDKKRGGSGCLFRYLKKGADLKVGFSYKSNRLELNKFNLEDYAEVKTNKKLDNVPDPKSHYLIFTVKNSKIFLKFLKRIQKDEKMNCSIDNACKNLEVDEIQEELEEESQTSSQLLPTDKDIQSQYKQLGKDGQLVYGRKIGLKSRMQSMGERKSHKDLKDLFGSPMSKKVGAAKPSNFSEFRQLRVSPEDAENLIASSRSTCQEPSVKEGWLRKERPETPKEEDLERKKENGDQLAEKKSGKNSLKSNKNEQKLKEEKSKKIQKKPIWMKKVKKKRKVGVSQEKEFKPKASGSSAKKQQRNVSCQPKITKKASKKSGLDSHPKHNSKHQPKAPQSQKLKLLLNQYESMKIKFSKNYQIEENELEALLATGQTLRTDPSPRMLRRNKGSEYSPKSSLNPKSVERRRYKSRGRGMGTMVTKDTSTTHHTNQVNSSNQDVSISREEFKISRKNTLQLSAAKRKRRARSIINRPNFGTGQRFRITQADRLTKSMKNRRKGTKVIPSQLGEGRGRRGSFQVSPKRRLSRTRLMKTQGIFSEQKDGDSFEISVKEGKERYEQGRENMAENNKCGVKKRIIGSQKSFTERNELFLVEEQETDSENSTPEFGTKQANDYQKMLKLNQNCSLAAKIKQESFNQDQGGLVCAGNLGLIEHPQIQAKMGYPSQGVSQPGSGNNTTVFHNYFFQYQPQSGQSFEEIGLPFLQSKRHRKDAGRLFKKKKRTRMNRSVYKTPERGSRRHELSGVVDDEDVVDSLLGQILDRKRPKGATKLVRGSKKSKTDNSGAGLFLMVKNKKVKGRSSRAVSRPRR